jgi:hypothetical protein
MLCLWTSCGDVPGSTGAGEEGVVLFQPNKAQPAISDSIVYTIFFKLHML